MIWRGWFMFFKRLGGRPGPVLTGFALALVLAFGPAVGQAQNPSVDELLSAVVKIRTFIPADARTADTLGREREGSGIVIDQGGLIVTVGYLMVEAAAAEITSREGRTLAAQIVAYDHETGFGLLRATTPLKVKPIPLGKSADVKERDPVLIASHGGANSASPAFVVSRREFAGSWEYLLDDAIFTAPPHAGWSGAALLSRDGKLVGVGSLIVGDATGGNTHFPGNMFVPIDRLAPILADLIADGRAAGPVRPWLGVTTEEVRGRLFVARVAADGPAEKAGIRRGDVIVGVGGEMTSGLADFYRKVWARGSAGVAVELNVLQGAELRAVTVQSADRRSHLRLNSTF